MQTFGSFQAVFNANGGTGTLSEVGVHEMGVFNLGVSYANPKIQKQCTADIEEQKRILGKEIAGELNKRLSAIQAADTLADLPVLDQPGNYKELTRDRKGQMSCRVSDAERLIFRPAQQPPPTMKNGNMDWRQVTDVELIKIVDYHKK